MINYFKSNFLAWLAGGAVFSLFLIMWSYFYAYYTDTITFEDTPTVQPNKLYPGDEFVIKRKIEIHKDIELVVNRYLTRETEEGLMTVELCDNKPSRKVGHYNLVRPLIMPQLIPPGKYLLHSDLKYYILFWLVHQETKPIEIEVLNGKRQTN